MEALPARQRGESLVRLLVFEFSATSWREFGRVALIGSVHVTDTPSQIESVNSHQDSPLPHEHRIPTHEA